MNPRDSSGTSKSLNRALNNLQGKLKNSFLNGYAHNTVPGYNLNSNLNIDNYDEENLMQLFKEFPYDSDLPRPLLPPARLPQCVLKNVDPALQLLSIKSEIKNDINRITEHHEKYRKDLTVHRKRQIKWKKNDKDIAQTSLPRFVAELAEIMESDPDPEFEGEYNWYYTGGSLNHLTLSNQNILLFPYAKEVVAASIDEKGKLWKPNLKNAAKCEIDNTLYEISHAVTSDSQCRILGRQKHSCILYSLSEVQGRLELDEIHNEQSSELPYISADLSQFEYNKYCVVKNTRSVELKDLNNIRCLNSISIPRAKSLPDNWMSVKFDQSDPNLVTIVDRCCLYHIDLRTPSDEPDLTLCPKSSLEKCENLSLITPSKHNPSYQYLGTYHSLLLCDSRFGNSSVVQKWTHQFKSPPLFCATVDRNDEEIVTLSSQFCGENAIILNNWTSETQMHSYSLPKMPSSISETLKACQDEGKCLDPSMRIRLELCNAGTTLNVNGNNGVTFFTQNSIGDVFYQCITNEKSLQNNSEMNKKSLIALSAWEEACLKQSKTVKPLVVSEKVNMKHVLDGMKNVNLHFEKKELGKPDFQPMWFQSMEKLNSYVDILAPELLSVWEIRQDSIPFSITPHQKVLSWLEKKTTSSSQSLTQSQSLIQSQEASNGFNETNEILSQELISVSQNLQENYTPDDNTTSEQQIVYNVPASDTNSKRKRSNKKRKYVAGF